MSVLYPLKPVVTTNTLLARKYNDDVRSAFLISACMTAQQAMELLDQGAQFDSVVLVNGEGEDVAARLGDPRVWSAETMPGIERLSLARDAEHTVAEIHRLLQRNMLVAGMG